MSLALKGNPAVMIEADRDKLVKILRMFSSHHDGEVAAAARRAHKIISDRKLDWDDLIIPVHSSRHNTKNDNRHESNSNNYEPDETDLINKCSELSHCLTEWEREFIESIGESVIEWGRLTGKQRAVLDRIVNKLKLRGLWEDI